MSAHKYHIALIREPLSVNSVWCNWVKFAWIPLTKLKADISSVN